MIPATAAVAPPRPPDRYIRGRAGRGSADLSTQPDGIISNSAFAARTVPRAKNFAVILSGTEQTL